MVLGFSPTSAELDRSLDENPSTFISIKYRFQEKGNRRVRKPEGSLAGPIFLLTFRSRKSIGTIVNIGLACVHISASIFTGTSYGRCLRGIVKLGTVEFFLEGLDFLSNVCGIGLQFGREFQGLTFLSLID